MWFLLSPWLENKFLVRWMKYHLRLGKEPLNILESAMFKSISPIKADLQLSTDWQTQIGCFQASEVLWACLLRECKEIFLWIYRKKKSINIGNHIYNRKRKTVLYDKKYRILQKLEFYKAFWRLIELGNRYILIQPLNVIEVELDSWPFLSIDNYAFSGSFFKKIFFQTLNFLLRIEVQLINGLPRSC